MQVRVYRSLDKPSSVLGIQGTYQRYTAAALAIEAVLSMIVAHYTVGLIGFAAFAVMGVLTYLTVMRIQAKYSERERDKKLSASSMPDFIIMPTHKLSRQSAVIYRKVNKEREQ